MVMEVINLNNSNNNINRIPTWLVLLLFLLSDIRDKHLCKREAEKGACSELSPISEGGVVDSGAMDTNIQQIIQESLRNAIPGIMRDTQKQLEASITDIVAKSIESFRKENQENLDYLEDRSSLKAMSEAEKLEQYNRRDNLKIYNVDEKDGETYEQTMDAVVSIAHEVGAEVHIKDISIAHRLPGRRRAIIVKFARRASKIKIAAEKKLAEKKRYRKCQYHGGYSTNSNAS